MADTGIVGLLLPMCRTVPATEEAKIVGPEDAVITTNLDGVIRSWNAAARQVWGYTAEEAVGRHISLLCCFPEAAALRRSAATRLAGAKGLSAGRGQGCVCGLLSAGQVQVSYARDESGRPAGYVIRSKAAGGQHEPRAKEQGEETARRGLDGGYGQDSGQPANRLDGLLWHLPGVVHSCTPEYPFIATFVARQVPRLFGYTRDDFMQTDLWLKRIHPDDVSNVLAAIGRLDGPLGSAIEYRFRHKDGNCREVRDTLSAVFADDGRLVEIVGYWEDITEEKHLERARQERERLRLAAMAALDGQETERARISRELHDDINQRLGVLILDVNALETASVGPQAPLRRELRRIRGELKGLSRDVHDLALKLHPPRIEGLGLVDAIDSECSSLSARSRIDMHFTVGELPSTISPLVSLCLYRVAKEALNNVVKHSNAQRGRVMLESSGGCLRLSIEDFGVGFDQQLYRKFGGLGIMNMEERVRVLGGSFSLHSKAGQGTCVTATVPLAGGTNAETEDTFSG